jgi:hypothetical protein
MMMIKGHKISDKKDKYILEIEYSV